MEVHLKELALAILATVFLPVVLLCLIPFIVYRWIVATLCPIFSKGILQIVSLSTSSLFATMDKEYHVTGNILITINLDDNIVYEELVDAVRKRMIEAKDARGRVLYPELTHHIVRRCGYFFWQKDSNFEIKDHVQLLTEPLNPGFKKAFLEEFFDPDKSPWKMLLVGSGKEVLFKFHHSLGDGYSLLNVLMSCTDETLARNRPKSTNIPFWKTIFFPTVSFYEMLTFNGGSPSPWGKVDEGISRNRNFANSRSLSKTIISERAKKLNASFTATLMGALGVGIHRLLKQENAPIQALTMDACIPFPSSSKVKSMDNTFSSAYMKIPVGPSLEENVKAMESTIRAAKNSTFPKTVQLVFQLSGLLGIPTMLRSLPPMQLLFSPMQGPREPLYINGVAVSGFYFQMNLIAYIPLTFNSVTYQGILKYVLSGGDKVFTEQMLEDLSNFIYQELSESECVQ